MKAAIYRRYGAPDVVRIEDVEKPVPKDDEVLVRIHATTISAPDWRFRRADPVFIRLMNGLSRPKRINVLGMEFAGIVESAGKDVTRFRAGDAVFGSMGLRFGAHAEYSCVVPDKRVERKPETMTFEEAAPLAFGGISALHFLGKAGGSGPDIKRSSTAPREASARPPFNSPSISARMSRGSAAAPISAW